MKIRLILYIALMMTYLVLDHQTYYYGLSKGWLSEKIPKEYYLDYGTYHNEKQSTSLMEEDMNLFLMNNRIKVCLDLYCNNSINVNEFLGYYFNDTDVIAEISDNNSKKHYLKTSLGSSFTEVHTIDKKKYKYINLQNRYIGLFLFIEYLCLFLISILSITFIWKFFINFRLN